MRYSACRNGAVNASDHRHWIHPRYPFFLPVKILSRVFRRKFLAGLKHLYRGKKRFPRSPFADVPLHADPFVCSLPVDTLSHNFPYALLQAHTALSPISMQPFQFADALPAFDWQTNIRVLYSSRRDTHPTD